MKVACEFNRDAINRPYINRGWSDERCWFFGLEWGNTGSDPVWAIYFEGRLPKWWRR